MNGLRVIDAGLQTTIQDLGRYGYQQYGLSVTGCVDKYALQWGNLLLGNQPSEAAIETTIFGLKLEVLCPMDIAVTGGDLGFHLGGKPAPMWATHRVNPGDRIEFRGGATGCRAYICIRGGICVDEAYGSRSTDTLVKLGGLNGQTLKKGDEIPVFSDTLPLQKRRMLSQSLRPAFPQKQEVRIVLGPQDHYFTDEAIQNLLSSEFTVTPKSNRIGCQLSGPKLSHLHSADILSEACAEGGIQVPASGQPIILLAGRRGVGGYPKIGTVISVDIPKVAQARPGSIIRFKSVSIIEAQDLLRASAKQLQVSRFWAD
jgi:antagonist of KipI